MYLSIQVVVYLPLQCTVVSGSCDYSISGDNTLSFSRVGFDDFTLYISVNECKFMVVSQKDF